MIRLICIALLLWAGTPLAWAVATISTSGTTYKTAEPTNSNVSHWVDGWYNTTGEAGITGWDYVGSIGGASAVYLGNGWVLTAAHVTLNLSSTFTLGGVGYEISDITSIGNADLKMFHISMDLSLPALTITGTQSLLDAGSGVVMIGYGGASGAGAESWGYNKVYALDYAASSSPYTTTTFYTINFKNDPNARGQLVGGDSGGADFYYDSSLGEWVLVGINCYAGTATDGINTYSTSFMADLSEYAEAIEAVMEVDIVPEPSAWALLATGGAALFTARFRRRR